VDEWNDKADICNFYVGEFCVGGGLMSDDINERFARFLRAVQLQDIRPMSLQSEVKGSMPPQGSELQLEWRQSFANGDPIVSAPDLRIFRPKYEFTVKFQDAVIFVQISIFVISFKIIDPAAYGELWADEELRKIFMEKQIQKTIWPLFRQHIHDGMSRLGMSPVTLPWIL
jgi:hypothetical protein